MPRCLLAPAAAEPGCSFRRGAVLRRFPPLPFPFFPSPPSLAGPGCLPSAMQRQLLCLGGGAGAPAARRVRLLLRQLLAPRPGRPELRALHGSGNAAPAAPRPGVGRGCVCVCVPPALGGAPGVGLGVLGAGLRLSVASPVVSLTPGEAGGEQEEPLL